MALDDAANGLASAVDAAIHAAGVTQDGQVGVGFPSAPELVEILANAGEAWQVSIYPLPGANPTPYPVDAIAQTQVAPTLTVAVAGNVVTLGGTVTVGQPVHIGIDAGLADVEYTTIAGDTLASIAAQLRDLVNAAAVGVTASASGPAVTIAGAASLSATVAAKGTLTLELGCDTAHLRVSVWAPDNVMRARLAGIIRAGVGTPDSTGIVLADGTTMACNYLSESWSDQSSPTYSLYVSHLVFECEYSITRTLDATQIAAGIVTAPGADGTTITRYTSGG